MHKPAQIPSFGHGARHLLFRHANDTNVFINGILINDFHVIEIGLGQIEAGKLLHCTHVLNVVIAPPVKMNSAAPNIAEMIPVP